jgi:hypothetical protein
MHQRDRLQPALQALQGSQSTPERKAYEWLHPIVALIESIPKKDDVGVTALARAKCALTITQQLSVLWWHSDNPELKDILRQPGTWKVILLTLQKTEDFHPDIMPKILNTLIEKQVEQKTKAMFKYAVFMAKDLADKNEGDLDSFCDKLAAMSNASLGSITAVSSKEVFCNERRICLYNQLLGHGYTQEEIIPKLLAMRSLPEKEFIDAEQLSNKWAKLDKQTDKEHKSLQDKLLNVFATSVLLQEYSHNPRQRIILAAENLIGNAIIIDEADNVLLGRIIEQQKAILQEDASEATAEPETEGEWSPEDYARLESIMAQSGIQPATENEEEFYDAEVEEEYWDAKGDGPLNTNPATADMDEDKFYYPEDIEEEEESDEYYGDLNKEDYALLYGQQATPQADDEDEDKYDEVDAEELISRFENLPDIDANVSLSLEKKAIADTAAKSSSLKTLVVGLLQGGFLDSSFTALSAEHNTTEITLIPIISDSIKALSSSGLSNFGLDLPADGSPWPSSSSGAVLRHAKYHNDPKYMSILKALEPDITALLPLITDPGLRDKLTDLVAAILESKPDKMYDIYAGIIALITPVAGPESSQSPELKLVAMFSSGDTPKHISNLILAILHNKFAIQQNKAAFQVTTDGKPLLQKLEPALTIILKSALEQQTTRKPLMKLFRELHNETIAGNQTLALLKSPHNMTHVGIMEFLALPPKEQAKVNISAATKAMLQKQILFEGESAIRRDNAIMHILGNLPFRTILDVHRKISFDSNNSMLMKITYPIHLTLLVLCLPIIASLPAIASAREHMAQPTNKQGDIEPTINHYLSAEAIHHIGKSIDALATAPISSKDFMRHTEERIDKPDNTEAKQGHTSSKASDLHTKQSIDKTKHEPDPDPGPNSSP